MDKKELLLAVAVLIGGIVIWAAVGLMIFLADGKVELAISLTISPLVVLIGCLYFFGGLTHLSCIVSDWQARRQIA